MNEVGGKKKLFRHVVIRSVTLAVLGIILWKQPGGAHPHYGFYSVLYRIGFSYFFAALILMNTDIRGQINWAFGLLIGHWLVMHLLPVPGFGMANFSQGSSADYYIGSLVAKYISPDFRYVFSINLVPSVSNALLGVLAGQWLMTEQSGNRKTIGLLISGIVLILFGLLIHLDFPINKKLSTTSFTLLTCGITASLLSAFYWIIDVKNYKKWSVFFVVVGMNSITIYVMSSMFNFYAVANTFVGGFNLGHARALVFATALATVKWLFLYYLYKQRIFLKI